MSDAGARSWCVARGTAPNATTVVVFTVPQGQVLLLKGVLAGGSAGVSTTLHVYAVSQSGATYVAVIEQTQATSGRFEWNGWAVLNPGDFVQVRADGSAVFYWMSGALLFTNMASPVQAPHLADQLAPLPADATVVA